MSKPIKILLVGFVFMLVLIACKHKKSIQKTVPVVTADTANSKCKIDYKNSKALIRLIKENEFNFDWINAKAKVETLIDGKEEGFDIKLKIRKDSAMLVQIEVVGGLVNVAKLLITKDSVKMVDYIHKQYFKGDFVFINEQLNADLDFEVVQAVLFGNSAEFHDDEEKLKPVTDRQNCHYILSTERKRKLRRIQQGERDLKKALQAITLNPENYKIINNEFIDPGTNRKFIADYKNFILKDSVFAPYLVDIDIQAEKKARINIEYVRIEKNKPQKLNLNIPEKYDPIQFQKNNK
ncbi:MAG: DUF4292 domain-containing protein [Sphingobacteriaceae bacterium]|nr:DUF4292 domain-containing protein [Sphingobacteriaceae bacterium]